MTSRSRSPGQKRKVGFAGPHPAISNVQRGTPCSKRKPTRETEERKAQLHLETEGRTLGHSLGPVVSLKGGVKHSNNHSPNIITYHLQYIYHPYMMGATPR